MTLTGGSITTYATQTGNSAPILNMVIAGTKGVNIVRGGYAADT